MLAIRYDKTGPAAEVLKPVQTDMPEPGKGQVRLRLVASPIHNHDLITVAGGYGVTPDLPAGAGSEALGVVDSLGPGVEGLKPGQRVIAAGLEGAWADYYLAPAERLTPVPDDLPDEMAAQIAGMPFDALTAFGAIGPEQGDWLVVNAANGAVGKAIMQIGESHGVRIAGLVYRQGAKDDLQAEGFADIFLTTDSDWSDQLRQQIGESRLAGGIDMVGGALPGEMLALMSPGATLLVMGAMSGEPMQVNVSPLIFGELLIRGFWAGKEASRMQPAQIRAMVEELIDMAVAGKLDLPVAKRFGLSQIAEAAEASGQERNGKVLLRPDTA